MTNQMNPRLSSNPNAKLIRSLIRLARLKKMLTDAKAAPISTQKRLTNLVRMQEKATKLLQTQPRS